MAMKRATAALAAAALLVAGCTRGEGGSGEDGVGAATAPPTSAATPAANAGAAGDEASSGGDVQCVLTADPTLYEIQLRHDGEAANYSFDVEFVRQDEVVDDEESVLIDAVQPGERVREGFLRTAEAGAATGCRVTNVSVTPVFRGLVGAADVGACQNLRKGEFGGYAYELTFTNGSTTVPAQYAAIVAIRNPAGERRISRLVYAKSGDGGFADVEPGETWTYTDDTISTPYEEGNTCEVVSVDKYTDLDFFADGATKGSLDADIGFATGSSELTDDAKLLLKPAVDQIAGSADVCVEGFADSVGSDDANLTLSKARADAVATFLTDSGVSATITSVGRGESEATADEVDDPALRRVDITLDACPA